MSAAAPPRARFRDHVRVAGLLGLTLLGALPYVVFGLVGPVWRLVVRRRLRRRLVEGDLEVPAEPPVPDPRRWDGKTVFVLAGEPSGDRLAAPIVAALRRHCPGLRLRGWAGPACAAAGVRLDRDLMERAVVGTVAVMRTLPVWWRLCAEFSALLRDDPPDLLLTVDFPGLNARLARWARCGGVKTVHVVVPAVWGYAGWRLPRWRRAVDHLLALLPFEPALLAGSGLPTTYVGHPLFEAPLPPPRTPETWPGEGACTVELLPGSRRMELLGQVPMLLEAAADLERALPEVRFVVRLAEQAHRARYEAGAALARRRPSRVRVDVGLQPLEAPLLAALASSGTVTAELGAALVPLTVTYRVTWLGRLAGWLYLTAPYFALVNLVAGRPIVRERLVLLRASSRRLGEDLCAVAADREAWTRTRADLLVVRRRLELPSVADRAARAILGPAPAAPRR